MKDTPLVSVVIPVFNGERYLADTLDSVLNQTYPNVEIIVVDDGSTDRTPEIIKTYARRVRSIRQINGGASKARNCGIRLGSGKYLAMQDADDLWEPEKLAVQVEYLETHPNIGLVHCHCEGIDEQGRTFIRWTNSDRKEDLYRLFMQGHVVGVFSAMIRRELLNRSGLFDEEFQKAGLEDIDFWSCLSDITPFHCLPMTLVKHRVHRYSTCRTYEETTVPLDHRRRMVNKLLAKYGDDPVRRRFLEKERVSSKNDLGKLLLRQGQVVEGRREIWEAIAVNLSGPRDLSRLFRSLSRLVRSIGARRMGKVQDAG